MKTTYRCSWIIYSGFSVVNYNGSSVWRGVRVLAYQGQGTTPSTGFVTLREIQGEPHELWDRKPPVFGRFLAGRDVRMGKNRLKLTVPPSGLDHYGSSSRNPKL